MIPYDTIAWLHGRDYVAPSDSESRFRKQLVWGRSYELMVGAFFVNHGIHVAMAAATDKEKQKQRKSLPDMLANGRRVECKSSRTRFGPAPSSHPSQLVELESVRSWTRKAEKPFAYVLVSKRTWNMIWTRGDNMHLWTVKKAHDKPYFYCPRDWFYPIEDLVKQLRETQHT